MCFDPKTQMYLYVKTHQCVVTYAARSCHLIHFRALGRKRSGASHVLDEHDVEHR